jgi:hypothetical protein
MVLSTLGTLFALTLVSARASVMHRGHTSLGEFLFPVAVVLGFPSWSPPKLAGAAHAARDEPTSENTSMPLITLITAATALAAHFGGSLPALLGA